jgi:hypothetical protein
VLAFHTVASIQVPKRAATYADLCALPEHLVGEIIDGELVTSRRPAPRFAIATTTLLGELRPFVRGRSGLGRWLALF